MTNLLHYRVRIGHSADIVPAVLNTIPQSPLTILEIHCMSVPSMMRLMCEAYRARSQTWGFLTPMKQDNFERANNGIGHPVSGTCQHITLPQSLCYSSDQRNKEVSKYLTQIDKNHKISCSSPASSIIPNDTHTYQQLQNSSSYHHTHHPQHPFAPHPNAPCQSTQSTSPPPTPSPKPPSPP